LLVGTACTACYLGLTQTARLIERDLYVGLAVERAEPSLTFEAMSVLYGVGTGMALGGLLLWPARRLRGMSFPTYPGEYLLIALGLFSAFGLGVRFLSTLMRSLQDVAPGLWFELLPLMLFGLVGAAIWFWAGALVRIRRWRRFFFLSAAVQMLNTLLGCGGIGPIATNLYVLLAVVLTVIVVQDHRQGFRYPWPHWLGVGIRLWFSLTSLGWFVLWTFFRDSWL
jgi:hypothetical protein